jgi:hypothetical protein
MRAFISHNKADRHTARALATLLVAQGEDVWFDEWEIQPGQSLVGGIEQGLGKADAFILVWSAAAQQSRWVGTEIRAYIRRRVDDNSLRVIPLMMDDTPLPVLAADYRGFDLSADTVSLEDVAKQIAGSRGDVELAQILQTKLNKLSEDNSAPGDPFPQLVCPGCGSANLARSSATDQAHDEVYYLINCADCGWGDWTQ